MVSLQNKILLFFMIIGLPLMGQSFTYSYIDPCTRATKIIYADMSAPIVIAYYGQVKAFTYTQLSDGTFDAWINDIYNQYKTTSPCQGVVTTTTTTTTTNTVSNLIGNVTSLVSLDFSSVTGGVSGGVGTNIGGTTSSGTGSVKTDKKDGNNNSNSSASSSNSGSTSNEGGNQTGENGGNPPENQGGSNGSGGGTVGGNSNSGNSSNSSSGSSGSGSGSGTSSEQPKTETEKPSDQKVEDTKTETQKSSSSATAKAAGKGKVETAKPAILMTGDIVGVQTKSDGAQDARGTMSFTKVKGDGTASIGFSADYMVNAKIGNISAVKSWIGTNNKGNKHINVVSDGLSIMPDALSNTLLFVRVNSIKNFTALYGGAATYGKLYGEEMISTIVIGGFMYKGKISKALDATIIMAGIYSPYSKYYTESLFKARPIIVPFLNLNYKLTKTFGVGLTGGGTYIAGKDVLNFQILMGAKMKI
jgi:hypothetical protein